MYHDGMDTVLPEVVLKDRKTRKPSKPQSFIPRTGKQIKVLFGEPLDFTAKVILNNRHDLTRSGNPPASLHFSKKVVEVQCTSSWLIMYLDAIVLLLGNSSVTS